MFSRISKVLMASCLACSFGAAAQAQSVDPEFEAAMAKAYAATKEDLVSALNQYLVLRSSRPDDVVVLYALGRTYHKLKQCDAPQNLYIEVMSALKETDVLYNRAVSAYTELDGCQNWEQVYFDCEVPFGGHVTVDDNPMAACWGDPLYLSPGEHVFRLYDADGNVIEETYTATAKEEGAEYEKHRVQLRFDRVREVERVVTVDHNYVYKDRFHPALYWGLIAGGAALVAGGGFMSAYANHEQVEERKQIDLYAAGNEGAKKKASDAHDRVVLGNALTYTLAGLGGAAVITGIVLAIVNATSERERVEESSVEAYIAPNPGGVSMGMGFRF